MMGLPLESVSAESFKAAQRSILKSSKSGGLNSQKADDKQPVEKNSTNFSAFTRGYPQPASKATGGGGYTHYTKRYPFPANMDDPYTTSDAAAIHGDIQHGMYGVRVCVSARAGVQYHSVGWPVSHAGGR